MKKPKTMEQVYQEYLKKSANFRKAGDIPPCCGTCHYFATETGAFQQSGSSFKQCCIGDSDEERHVSPEDVCDFYRRFDNPPESWEDNFDNEEDKS